MVNQGVSHLVYRNLGRAIDKFPLTSGASEIGPSFCASLHVNEGEDSTSRKLLTHCLLIMLTRIELAWNRSKQSARSQKVQVVQRTTIRCFAEKNSAPDLEQTSELRGHNQIKNHKNFWDLSQRISSTPSPCFVEQVSTANLQHAFPSKGGQVSCVDTSK